MALYTVEFAPRPSLTHPQYSTLLQIRCNFIIADSYFAWHLNPKPSTNQQECAAPLLYILVAVNFAEGILQRGVCCWTNFMRESLYCNDISFLSEQLTDKSFNWYFFMALKMASGYILQLCKFCRQASSHFLWW